MNRTAIILTGGTITKAYDRYTGLMENDNCDDEVLRGIINNAGIAEPFHFYSISSKDSKMLNRDDLDKLKTAICALDYTTVIVIHGTDHMVATANHVGKVEGKTVVFTGAFVPHSVHNSDAEFNVGFAVGVVGLLPPGTYIAMNGKVFDHNNALKNIAEQRFMEKE